ncbi:hypothetical protein C5O27_16015 [Gordonia alkanivorans]|nr:hypothetical protein C5O27_16015 [Gordonia alkanivorans]
MSTRGRRCRTTRLIAAIAVSGLAIVSSACNQESDASTGESLQIVLGSPPQASQIPLVYGVDHYGGDLGLNLSVEQNVTITDTHTDAVKTLSDADAEVLATSFSAILDARKRGEDLKVFCPYVSMDDFVLAGANGVNTAGSCSRRRPAWASTARAAPAPSSSTRC